MNKKRGASYITTHPLFFCRSLRSLESLLNGLAKSREGPARSVRVAAKLFGRMVRWGKRNPAIRGECIAGREGN